MNIIFNFPKDKTNIESGIACIRAILMQRYIDNLNVDNDIKKRIKESLIEELKKT